MLVKEHEISSPTNYHHLSFERAKYFSMKHIHILLYVVAQHIYVDGKN